MRRLAKRGNMNDRMDIALTKFRSRMTSYPPGMCPLVMYRSILQMSMNQSCGKCVPCRDGLVEAERMLRSILTGDATEETLKKLEELCIMISQTADCAVGVVAANTLLDSLKEFADEYESHIKRKRCVDGSAQTVPCMTLCPAHVDVPGYVALIKDGDYAGAINVIRDRNPFPTACAMVCEHPCEKKCRRSIIDAPINIRGLKKYAVDQISADKVKTPPANVKTGKVIGIVGGGPSGLTAAYFLALMGHKCVVYDEHDKLGGMLRYGIPEYRLPKARLDEDINAILAAGDIEVKTNTKIGTDVTVEELLEKYDALYLGLGAQLGNRMPVENADCKNVIPAADFLQAVARGEEIDLTGKNVVLIGGGNVAMDAARTAIRLHAKSVHVFTRKRDDYTALESEIESAMQEGVRFRTLLSFLHLEEDKNNPGYIDAVWLQPQIVGEYDEFGLVKTEHSSAYPYRFTCDYLILGVGQRCDVEAFDKAGIPTERGRILADESCMIQGIDGVFSGGDCVTGPSTAINAIAAGQVAAHNIDEYLGYHHKIVCEVETPNARPNKCIPTGRAEIEERDPFERRKDFEHVEIRMTPEEAEREAGRCLRCDHFGCGSMEGGRCPW
ncbi:MAG: FAD-dependent oxidoreductase [Lachnospiraceae bacterium]|nr:FAD-dependent oxidoreductase [Lachnospiraceae bacterium]